MLGNISPVQLVIILVIVLLLFGTKKLRNIGGDLGGAVKGFKKAMSDDDTKPDAVESDGEGKQPESASVEEKAEPPK